MVTESLCQAAAGMASGAGISSNPVDHVHRPRVFSSEQESQAEVDLADNRFQQSGVETNSNGRVHYEAMEIE